MLIGREWKPDPLRRFPRWVEPNLHPTNVVDMLPSSDCSVGGGFTSSEEPRNACVGMGLSVSRGFYLVAMATYEGEKRKGPLRGLLQRPFRPRSPVSAVPSGHPASVQPNREDYTLILKW